jgi:hypothetical protein
MRKPIRRYEVFAEGGDRNFSADVGFDFVELCGGVKSGGAVEAVPIGESHCGHADVHCTLDVGFGGGRTGEKAEGAGGVKFDVFIEDLANEDFG